ncbi:hypothetical protein SAMN04487786_2607 [Paenisporosarcina quisquiliarum]|nr:hypothetical protein SAMN04487786_2607 [Paenisporosarcina quisquiliarum]
MENINYITKIGAQEATEAVPVPMESVRPSLQSTAYLCLCSSYLAIQELDYYSNTISFNI